MMNDAFINKFLHAVASPGVPLWGFMSARNVPCLAASSCCLLCQCSTLRGPTLSFFPTFKKKVSGMWCLHALLSQWIGTKYPSVNATVSFRQF